MNQILKCSNKNLEIIATDILKDLMGKVDNRLTQVGNFNIEVKTIGKSNRNTGGGCDIRDREKFFWQVYP